MNKSDKNYIIVPEKQPVKDDLLISVTDTVMVKARVTFDCEIFQGYQITYWQDDDTDITERVNDIFDILFEEVLKTNKFTNSACDNVSNSILVK